MLECYYNLKAYQYHNINDLFRSFYRIHLLLHRIVRFNLNWSRLFHCGKHTLFFMVVFQELTFYYSQLLTCILDLEEHVLFKRNIFPLFIQLLIYKVVSVSSIINIKHRLSIIYFIRVILHQVQSASKSVSKFVFKNISALTKTLNIVIICTFD